MYSNHKNVEHQKKIWRFPEIERNVFILQHFQFAFTTTRRRGVLRVGQGKRNIAISVTKSCKKKEGRNNSGSK